MVRAYFRHLSSVEIALFVFVLVALIGANVYNFTHNLSKLRNAHAHPASGASSLPHAFGDGSYPFLWGVGPVGRQQTLLRPQGTCITNNGALMPDGLPGPNHLSSCPDMQRSSGDNSLLLDLESIARSANESLAGIAMVGLTLVPADSTHSTQVRRASGATFALYASPLNADGNSKPLGLSVVLGNSFGNVGQGNFSTSTITELTYSISVFDHTQVGGSRIVTIDPVVVGTFWISSTEEDGLCLGTLQCAVVQFAPFNAPTSIAVYTYYYSYTWNDLLTSAFSFFSVSVTFIVFLFPMDVGIQPTLRCRLSRPLWRTVSDSDTLQSPYLAMELQRETPYQITTRLPTRISGI